MNSMEDEPFLKAIIAGGKDDWESRLIYADWLEERGDDRCAILRAYVRIHRDEARVPFLEILPPIRRLGMRVAAWTAIWWQEGGDFIRLVLTGEVFDQVQAKLSDSPYLYNEFRNEYLKHVAQNYMLPPRLLEPRNALLHNGV